MSKTSTSYRTGDIVQQAGDYISDSGRRIKFKEGDKLPYCPITGLDTTWFYVG